MPATLSPKERLIVAVSTVFLFLATVLAIAERFDNSLVAIGQILVMALLVAQFVFTQFAGAYLVGLALIAFSCVACTLKLQRAVGPRV